MQINALPFLSHKSDITNINFEINHKRKKNLNCLLYEKMYSQQNLFN